MNGLTSLASFLFVYPLSQAYFTNVFCALQKINMHSSRGTSSSQAVPNRFLRTFFRKLLVSGRLLIDLVRLFPLRLVRLVEHTQRGVRAFDRQAKRNMGRRRIWSSIARWWIDGLFLLIDLSGLVNVYELLQEWFKPGVRDLYDWEKELARSVFGDSIRYGRVRIDERAWIGPRQYRICYVSANTINTWGGMNNSLLVHELVHVWQYQHLGLVYIPRSLRAQRSKAGYNYGGATYLTKYKELNKMIFDFNPEQQADIVSDYYRLREGYPPRWGNAGYSDLPVYIYFVEQLRQGMEKVKVGEK